MQAAFGRAQRIHSSAWVVMQFAFNAEGVG
jgi:hypothetical protein